MSEFMTMRMPPRVQAAYREDGNIERLLSISSFISPDEVIDVAYGTAIALERKHGRVWVTLGPYQEEEPLSEVLSSYRPSVWYGTFLSMLHLPEYGGAEGTYPLLRAQIEPIFQKWWNGFTWQTPADVDRWALVGNEVFGRRQFAWMASACVYMAAVAARGYRLLPGMLPAGYTFEDMVSSVASALHRWAEDPRLVLGVSTSRDDLRNWMVESGVDDPIPGFEGLRRVLLVADTAAMLEPSEGFVPAYVFRDVVQMSAEAGIMTLPQLADMIRATFSPTLITKRG